jgi:hypothetical protein
MLYLGAICWPNFNFENPKWTALSAMETLPKGAQGNLRLGMAGKAGVPVRPTICIHNIDMVENFHAFSVGS